MNFFEKIHSNFIVKSIDSWFSTGHHRRKVHSNHALHDQKLTVFTFSFSIFKITSRFKNFTDQTIARTVVHSEFIFIARVLSQNPILKAHSTPRKAQKRYWESRSTVRLINNSRDFRETLLTVTRVSRISEIFERKYTV